MREIIQPCIDGCLRIIRHPNVKYHVIQFQLGIDHHLLSSHPSMPPSIHPPVTDRTTHPQPCKASTNTIPRTLILKKHRRSTTIVASMHSVNVQRTSTRGSSSLDSNYRIIYGVGLVMWV